jgi:hypothetical protein
MDSFVAAALVGATWVQSCWSWRPLVHVTGESNAGKSTLFNDLLKPLFGDWAILAERCTEAALRQAIGHHACPVLIDEFDDYRARDQVCELFRTAGRGGTVLRGSPDQTGRRFRVRHLAWFASIESGGNWSQDRNRRIRLELLLRETRQGLVLPSAAELAALGQELAAAAIWAAPWAVVLADALKRIRIEGAPERLVESFSVPAAMCAVMCGGRDVEESNAIELLQGMLTNRQGLDSQGEPEQVRLLRDIMSSTRIVPAPSGGSPPGTWTVAQLLTTQNSALSSEHLEPVGIRLLRRRTAESRSGTPEIFIVAETVQRHLLRGTRWERIQIDQLLMRLGGASHDQQRCGGLRPWGIVLPWPECLGGLEPQDAGQDDQSG